jgi:tRNA uridine 5-carboxymethylaminomethyl modification enzyme
VSASPAKPLAEWVRQAGVGAETLRRLDARFNDLPGAVLDHAIEDHRYAPYVSRQHTDVERMRREEGRRIPDDLDYRSIAGLSAEMVERLSRSRPTNLGAASRVQGITPAALTAILAQSERRPA